MPKLVRNGFIWFQTGSNFVFVFFFFQGDFHMRFLILRLWLLVPPGSGSGSRRSWLFKAYLIPSSSWHSWLFWPDHLAPGFSWLLALQAFPGSSARLLALPEPPGSSWPLLLLWLLLAMAPLAPPGSSWPFLTPLRNPYDQALGPDQR